MYIHVAVKNKSKVVNFCTVYSTISNYNGGVAIYILQFSVTKIPINTLRQQKDKEIYSHHCVHNTCTCNCTNHLTQSYPASPVHYIINCGYDKFCRKVIVKEKISY